MNAKLIPSLLLLLNISSDGRNRCSNGRKLRLSVISSRAKIVRIMSSIKINVSGCNLTNDNKDIVQRMLLKGVIKY
jgi:hypothetical protein